MSRSLMTGSALLLVGMLSACKPAPKAAPPPPAAAEPASAAAASAAGTDLLKTQRDALDKARAVEGQVREQADARQKAINDAQK